MGNAWVHLYATMTTAPSLPQGKGATHMHLPTSDSICMSVKTCGNVADRQFCGAMKLTMFYNDRNQLQVYYAGTHTCSLRMRPAYTVMPEKVKKAVLKPILQKNPQATTKQISEEAAENFLRIGKPDMAVQSIRIAQDRKTYS